MWKNDPHFKYQRLKLVWQPFYGALYKITEQPRLQWRWKHIGRNRIRAPFQNKYKHFAHFHSGKRFLERKYWLESYR